MNIIDFAEKKFEIEMKKKIEIEIFFFSINFQSIYINVNSKYIYDFGDLSFILNSNYISTSCDY